MLSLLIDLHAQQPFYRYHYQQENGLKHEIVKSVVVDQVGFVWLATDKGLIWFDGRQFTEIGDSELTSGMKDLHILDEGQMLATTDNGLLKAKVYPHEPEIQLLMQGSSEETDSLLWYPKQIYQSSSGDIWLSDNYRIYRYHDNEDHKVTRYAMDSKNISHQFNRSYLFFEATGSLFALSQQGFLYRLEEEKNEFVEMAADTRWKSAGDLLRLKNGRILLGTDEHILELQFNDTEFKHSKIVASGISISSFERLQNGEIFAGSWTEGLFQMTMQDGGEISFSKIAPFSNEAVNDITSHGNQLWVATDDGLILLTKQKFSGKHSNDIDGTIQGISPDSGKGALVTESNRVWSVPNQMGRDAPQKLFQSDRTLLQAVRNKKGLWVSTADGLIQLIKDGSIEKEFELSAYGGAIFNIKSDVFGNLWAVQDKNERLIRISPDYSIKQYGPGDGLKSRQISLYIDSSQTLYTGGIDKESYLHRYDKKSDRFRNISPSLDSLSIKGLAVNDIAGKSESLFLGTSEGFFRYNKKNQLEKIVLPDMTDEGVKAITVDRGGIVWLANKWGLVRFDGLHTTVYDETSGLPSKVINYRSLLTGSDGNIWIGTISGLGMKVSDSLPKITPKPRLLHSESVDGNFFLPGETITIKTNQFLQFSYASPVYPGVFTTYQVRIPGLDDAWSEQNDGYLISALPTGSYQLQIKARQKGDYFWSNTLTVPFRVNPHWYQTWWAITCIIILGITLLGGGITYYTSNLKGEQKKLKNLVDERTSQLRESEKKLRQITENTNEVFWLRDRNNKDFLYVNPAYEKVWGRSIDSLYQHRNSYLEAISEFDKDRFYKEMESYEETQEFDITCRLRQPDGSIRWVHICQFPVTNDEGEIISHTGTAVDITDLKQTEEKLQHATRLLKDAQQLGKMGAWELDLKTNKTIWTDEVYKIHEVDKDFDHNKANGLDFYHPEDRPKISGALENAIQNEQHFDVTCWFITARNNQKWVRVSGYPVKKNGKTMRLSGMIQDVTEQKRAQIKAEEASKAKSEFLANMSHEIRTPMNAVIGFTELLKDTKLTVSQKKYVESIHSSGNSLLGIINEILDFSKIEAGKLELETVKTDLYELARNTAEIIAHTAAKKNIEVLLNIDLDMPRFGIFDPLRLRQILTNLLSNAVKFTEEGEIELRISFDNLGNNRGRYSFMVRDTGLGIPKQQQQNLFKAFTQADSSTTRKHGGTGLGLTITHRLVHMMGGKLALKSTPGEGSVFYFNLESEFEEGPIIQTDDIENLDTCLIIDDNENNRTILDHMLTKWGIKCQTCSEGSAAIKVLRKQGPFDLIICDYHMPEMDGLQTISKIRNKLNLSPVEQPIILLHSSADDAKLHKKCGDLGVRFNITKPIEKHELLQYLTQLHAPSSPEQEASESPSSTSASASTSGVPDNNSLRDLIGTILIAEDNKASMLLARTTIKKYLPKAKVIEARNGRRALEKIEKYNPDLVFMDVQMPEMDGNDATQDLRKKELERGLDHTIVIGLTAGALKHEREKSLKSGMDEFMTKPFDTQTLKKVLDKYLQNA